jgi:hypothetical protein
MARQTVAVNHCFTILCQSHKNLAVDSVSTDRPANLHPNGQWR